jgi:hypothetical protein
MNPGTIPAKTDKGRQEMVHRTDMLNAVQRRLLILVDGHRTINDLEAFVRAGELAPALAHLFAHGFVVAPGAPVVLAAPAGPGFAAQDSAQPVRAATSPKEFERVRAEASQFIHQRLGEAALPICAAVDRCTSPQELRQMLRGVEVFVGQRLDAQTTQSFARRFGAMLL